jgi:hypothetical protein
VLNIADPRHPLVVAADTGLETVRDIFVTGNYAYLAGAADGLHIVDISNPQMPVLVSTFEMSGGFCKVIVQGQYAYLTGGTPGGLHVVDISDPFSPVAVGSFETAYYPSDLSITGGYAYIVDEFVHWYQGARGNFYIVDISNPASPTPVAVRPTPVRLDCVTVAGNYAYMTGPFIYYYGGYWCDFLYVFDISDPVNPISVGNMSIDGSLNSAKDLAVAGGRLYLTKQYSGGLWAINIDDPAYPILAGTIAAPGNGRGIAVSGECIYAANWYSLMVFYIGPATDIDGPEILPNIFALHQNYPNPFNAQTIISYSLDRSATVSLLIYAITGQRVTALALSERQEASQHRYVWDGTDAAGKPVSTGIYFYELHVDDYRESKAMILAK